MLRTPSGSRLAAPRRAHRPPRSVAAPIAASADGTPPPAGGAWSPGRFLRQVLFFNPGLNPLNALRSLLGGGDGGGAAGPPRVVVVTGATGGVGKRVVARLLAAGTPVRAVVRNAAKAERLLGSLPRGAGASLEVVQADLTQAATLPPALADGVAAVVSAHAVVVTPKEGDDADRSKYYQGIKFYDPTIADDSPQAVEGAGMANLLAALAPTLAAAGGAAPTADLPIFDPAAACTPAFGPLDDVVMGGASASEFRVVAGAGEGGADGGVFTGTLTEAGGGGFASVRTKNFVPPLDLSSAAGVALRVQGDGRRYKLILRNSAGWDSPTYTAVFQAPPDGVWDTVRLPWSAFVPIFRAKTIPGAPPIDPSTIHSVQLMLSKFEKDGALNPTHRVGPFRLPVARMWAYKEAGTEAAAAAAASAPPVWVHVSSAGVTRPSRPGIDVDAEPPAVKMNAMLGGILDWKLAAEDALRASGLRCAVVRPTALTEEPGGMPIELGQGDTLKGKISRDDVADLCVALLACRGLPSNGGLTFELKSTVPFAEQWTGPPAGAPARDWCAVVGAAGLEAGVTGKTVGGVYSGTRKEADVAAEAGVKV